MERAPLTHRRTHRSPRGVRTLLVALLGVLAMTLTAFAGPVAAKPGKQPPGASRSADPARTVGVMTRNLYLGAELTGLVEALVPDPDTGEPDPAALIAAATQTWNQVVDSDPAERMAAVADEIVAAKPHAVGLQEVTRYTTYDYNPAAPEDDRASNPTVAYDLLDLLLDALADRGLNYREVTGATAENFTSDPIPYLTGVSLKAVQLLDRDVIIVRGGVKATNARNGNFTNVLDPLVGFPIRVDRGWGSADLRTKLARFRFVNSHTEAFGDEIIRVLEVEELFDAQDEITALSGALPTVYAGDFNSDAPPMGEETGGEDAYNALLAGGLRDLWVQARPGATDAQSDTCCQAADLRNAVSQLDSRIDLLLGTKGVKAIRADRVGDEPVSLPDGVRWSSDHAGVVADVIIPPKA